VPHGAVAVHRPRQNSSSGGVAFTAGSSSSCDTPATVRSAAAAAPAMTSLAAAAAARQARLELGHNLGMSPHRSGVPHRSDSPQIVTSFDDVAPERDPDVWPPPTPDPSGSAAVSSGRRGSSGGSGSAGNNRVLPWASRGDEQGERGGSGPGKLLFEFIGLNHYFAGLS
jgi:hypothetical protein